MISLSNIKNVFIFYDFPFKINKKHMIIFSKREKWEDTSQYFSNYYLFGLLFYNIILIGEYFEIQRGLRPTPSTLTGEKYGFVSPKSVNVNKN